MEKYQKLHAFLRQKQQPHCEIENKILEAHAIVDTAKETIRVAEGIFFASPG